VLWFGYSDRRMLEVLATIDACPFFTNGTYTAGDFSPGFATYLRIVNRLVPPQHQHRSR